MLRRAKRVKKREAEKEPIADSGRYGLISTNTGNEPSASVARCVATQDGSRGDSMHVAKVNTEETKNTKHERGGTLPIKLISNRIDNAVTLPNGAFRAFDDKAGDYF